MSRGAPPSTDENPAIVFDRAAERVCRGCALCDLCWQREYTGTFNALNDATPTLLERGRAMPKDFPGYFADRCIHLQDFITAVNGELSAFLLRRQYRRQLEETRRSARGQYAQLSELLTATAAGLGEAVPAAGGAGGLCRVGAVLRPKAGETVCGDTVVSFRMETGQWCLLLADGMGSGEAARKESALTCRLLRQFLEAGIEPEAALKTLNSAMALRGAETGSFTTVDLCVCAPAAGETVFYKFGAAPSYLKKGGAVRRITGGSLPVGLRGAPASPDVTRAALDPGGFVVMVSDGVADPGRDEWLLDLLAGWEGDDPQTLAGLILTESVRREGLQDDCGVQVLYRAPEGEKIV
jgi:stage II sporulation protein E